MQKLITFILVIFLSTNQAKMIRNNALITKMVSNFHQDNDDAETNKEAESVLIRMQNVLCKNFPTIPCDLIIQDHTLKKLIKKSIQQINSKKLTLNKTASLSGYRTPFPSLNNEDLSNFIQVSDIFNRHGGIKNNKLTREGNLKVNARTRKKIPQKRHRKVIKNKARATSLHYKQKMRKYFPHKVKYANKIKKRPVKENFVNKDVELSISEEVTYLPITEPQQHFAHKVDPENSPVWRIDYTKHSDPNINNLFDFDLTNRFNKKVIKYGPMPVDANEQTEERLHADLFTQNNYVKITDTNSNDVE